ncbi:MAG: putative quinol monooxygenase [Gammaproteobacteria bacterium]
MPYVVAATLRVKQRYVDEYTDRIKKHALNSVTKEAGCVSFEVGVDRSDPRRFLLYEVYVDEKAFQAHTRYPFMTRHIEETARMIEGDVELVGFWDRLAAPDK